MMCTLSTPSFGPPDVKHFASAVLVVAIASITAIHHAIIASGFAIASNVIPSYLKKSDSLNFWFDLKVT
jgi:hypothetical protein